MRRLVLSIAFAITSASRSTAVTDTTTAAATATGAAAQSAETTPAGNVAATTATAPALMLTPAALDLGRRLQNQSIEKTVTVRNQSADTLEISRVFSDCGCTVTQVQNDRLAPGESTTLTVIFETRGYLGEIRRTVTLNTSDGVFTLPVSITVAQHKNWDVTPSPTFMRPSYSDRPAKLEVVARTRDVTKSVTLKTASANVPWLQVTISPPAQGAQTITLLKTPEASPGSHTVFVTLKSDSADDEPLVLQVIVPVAPTITATPSPILLPASKPGEVVSTTFRIVGWNDTTPPATQSELGRVEYVREISGEHEFRLTYQSTETGETVGSVLILRGKKTELEIPFLHRTSQDKTVSPATP